MTNRKKRIHVLARFMSILCLGLALLAVSNANCKEMKVEKSKFVTSETGFEGSVTVASEQVTDGLISVTVNVPYIDIYGKPKMGQARLFLREDKLKTGAKLPLVSIAHYEVDAGTVKTVCDAGWAAVTPHYGSEKGEYPLEFCGGDSYNLARAINQWARRLPFIDRNHMHIYGGSAGGYMTLAMCAECFPVSSAYAGMPLFNFAYNLNYLRTNSKYTEMMTPDGKDKILPVISVVVPIADQACAIYGDSLADDKWYYISPLSQLDRITCPIVVTGATGDTLCPAVQLTAKHAGSWIGQGFPDGFSMDFESLTKVDLARKRLDEVIPVNEMNLIVLPKPADAVEMGYKQVIGGEPAPPEIAKMKLVDISWSKDKQWNLLLHDEGSPAPYSGHMRYYWNETSAWSFAALHKTETPSPAILNAAKLARLMDRYMGISDRQVTVADGSPVHRLNYEGIEKLDVVTGLLDYADMGAAHLARLKELYKGCATQPFGPTLERQQLVKIREDLLK
ncbi:MAG: alpha/beta hydrolase family protein [Armatimonadota bacterium]